MYLEYLGFSKEFKFLKQKTNSIAGVWSLYQNINTNQKFLIKEIEFYDKNELKIFIEGV